MPNGSTAPGAGDGSPSLPTPSPPVQSGPAARAVELALRAATAYHRPDLADRARQALRRLGDSRVRVLVVGEFKQGKSLLVNALVNAPICPVDDDISTSVPTVVRYAADPSVTLVRASRSGDGDEEREEHVRIPIEDLAGHVSEAGNPGNRAGLAYAEVGIPRRILADGLELVDTPGVGGLGSVHGSATTAILPSADAILLVSDAGAEYTGPELEFLRQASRVCPNVGCVLAKTDLYPQWRRIADLDRGHLAAAGIDADLLVVSSVLRLHAAAADDRALNAESGFPDLVGFLRDRVVGQSARLTDHAAANDVVAISEQLAAGLRAELAACEDPEHASGLVAELERARQRAVELRDRSSRWQQTLNDGIADLFADVDYDLRDRMRDLVHEAESVLDDAGDPAPLWGQFAAQVHKQAAAAAVANFLWTSERTRWLARRVAEEFAEDGARSLPEPQIGSSELVAAVREMQLPVEEKFGFAQKALTGLRGGYIGTLMAGMYSTFAGLALMNPFSAAAGLLMGGKMIRDEKRRLLDRRRMEAKNAVRRYVDDVSFQVGKESRDVLRRVQRELRDHFVARSEELLRSAQESLLAAERALQSGEVDRRQRAADVRAELERVAALEQQGRALVSVGAAAGTLAR